jgi:hypothetical protein
VVDRFERDAGGGLCLTLGGNTVHLGGGAHHRLPLRRERTSGKRAGLRARGRAAGRPDRRSDGRGGRFLISHRSEEPLEKKYGRDALTLALVAAGLFLFGLIFVVVGILVDAG